MSKKSFDQEVAIFKNGLRSGNPSVVRYQEFSEDYDFPSYMIQSRQYPMQAFLCAKKTNGILSVGGSVNQKSFGSSEGEKVRLTLQCFEQLRCKTLLEMNNVPVALLGDQECDFSNGVDQLFCYVHANQFSHICIFDSTICQTPISIYSQDSDARLLLIHLFSMCIDQYKELIDIPLFMKETSLVCNQQSQC